MKSTYLIIALLFALNHSVCAQDLQPLEFGDGQNTNIDEDKLYSEFEKLFDEFQDSCYSKRIGSRSPFINLLARSLNKSGSSFSLKSKKIKNSNQACFDYIQNDMDFTFGHYYTHYCKISSNEDDMASSELANKGISTAEKYHDDFDYACNNDTGKKSKMWFDDWNSGLNVWSKLLTEKANFKLNKMVIERERIEEEARQDKLAEEMQIKENQRIAEVERKRSHELQKMEIEANAKQTEIDRQREHEEEKLRLMAEAKQAELNKLRLLEESKNKKVVQENSKNIKQVASKNTEIGNNPSSSNAVEVRVILNAYKNNEVGADNLYQNKRIRVVGIISDIKKDLFDNLYVTLGTGRDFEIPEFQAFFQDSMNAQLGKLNKGSRFTVECVIDGLMLNVIAKKCIIL